MCPFYLPRSSTILLADRISCEQLSRPTRLGRDQFGSHRIPQFPRDSHGGTRPSSVPSRYLAASNLEALLEGAPNETNIASSPAPGTRVFGARARILRPRRIAGAKRPADRPHRAQPERAGPLPHSPCERAAQLRHHQRLQPPQGVRLLVVGRCPELLGARHRHHGPLLCLQARPLARGCGHLRGLRRGLCRAPHASRQPRGAGRAAGLVHPHCRVWLPGAANRAQPPPRQHGGARSNHLRAQRRRERCAGVDDAGPHAGRPPAGLERPAAALERDARGAVRPYCYAQEGPRGRESRGSATGPAVTIGAGLS